MKKGEKKSNPKKEFLTFTCYSSLVFFFCYSISMDMKEVNWNKVYHLNIIEALTFCVLFM